MYLEVKLDPEETLELLRLKPEPVDKVDEEPGECNLQLEPEPEPWSWSRSLEPGAGAGAGAGALEVDEEPGELNLQLSPEPHEMALPLVSTGRNPMIPRGGRPRKDGSGRVPYNLLCPGCDSVKKTKKNLDKHFLANNNCNAPDGYIWGSY